jgi:hypothetical protein
MNLNTQKKILPISIKSVLFFVPNRFYKYIGIIILVCSIFPLVSVPDVFSQDYEGVYGVVLTQCSVVDATNSADSKQCRCQMGMLGSRNPIAFDTNTNCGGIVANQIDFPIGERFTDRHIRNWIGYSNMYTNLRIGVYSEGCYPVNVQNAPIRIPKLSLGVEIRNADACINSEPKNYLMFFSFEASLQAPTVQAPTVQVPTDPNPFSRADLLLGCVCITSNNTTEVIDVPEAECVLESRPHPTRPDVSLRGCAWSTPTNRESALSTLDTLADEIIDTQNRTADNNRPNTQ